MFDYTLEKRVKAIAETAASAEVRELAGVVAKLIKEIDRLEKELHQVRSRSHG